MNEFWHPSLKILDIVERCEQFIKPIIAYEISNSKPIYPALKTLFALIMVSILRYLIILYYMPIQTVEIVTSGCGVKSIPNLPMHKHVTKFMAFMQRYLFPMNLEEMAENGIDIDEVLENQTAYTTIVTLVMLEVFIYYGGLAVLVIRTNAKLTKNVKHSITLLAFLLPLSLFDDVSDNKYDKIAIGFICWAIFGSYINIPAICVFCFICTLHMNPMALPVVIILLFCVCRKFIYRNQMGVRIDFNSIQEMVDNIAQNTTSLFSVWVAFFMTLVFIWMPWILDENLTEVIDIVSHAYFHHEDKIIFVFQLLFFIMILGFNTHAILNNTSDKIFKYALFNVMTGYSICFNIKDSGIFLVIVLAFLAFFELKEIII